jgi:hypothetical protein
LSFGPSERNQLLDLIELVVLLVQRRPDCAESLFQTSEPLWQLLQNTFVSQMYISYRSLHTIARLIAALSDASPAVSERVLIFPCPQD